MNVNAIKVAIDKTLEATKLGITSYDTEAEMGFIMALGYWRPQANNKVEYQSPVKRLRLLLMYKKALKKRVKWGKIDRIQVLNFLDYIIDNEGDEND